MALIFESRDLLTIVDGTEKRPKGEVANVAVVAQIKCDMTASILLVHTID
jgi:hypothetical protein